MSVGCLELARNGATIIRDGRDAAELAGPIGAEDVAPLFGMPVERDHGIAALPPVARRVWEALPARAGLVTSSTRGWARREDGDAVG